MPSRVLFLCTGNYYRSRFAEVVFNLLASQRGLAWEAESRGLACELGHNIGPISQHTHAELSRRGVSLPEPLRFPLQVTEEELGAADRIVALKEAEHRGYLTRRYPAWPDRVTYWHVHDLDKAGPETALAEIDALVAALVDELARAPAID